MIEKALLILIGGICTVFFKLLYDVIKPSKVEDKHHCEDHTECTTRIAAMETCNSVIKRDHASLAATFQAHVEHVNKRLDQGQENFKALREDVGRISLSLTKIATVIEERTYHNDQPHR